MATPDIAEPIDDDEAIAAEQDAQVAEYSQWVATQDILHDGALAYSTGYPVPASNVETYGYDKLGWVAKVGAEDIAEPAEEESADEPG